MIITPFSALDTAGELPVTAANFPALKHFFPCDETGRPASMTDVIGGVVIPLTAADKPDAYSIDPQSVSDGVALTSGSWVAPGTKATISFYVGKASSTTSNKVQMGLTPDGVGSIGINICASAIVNPAVGDVDTQVDATVITASTTVVYGRGLIIEFGGNVTSFEAIGTGASAYSAKTPVALTGIASLSSIPSNASLAGLTSMYGWAVFEFTNGIPGDVAAAITWMTYQWQQGNKVIYPGWKGLL